jgi:hypothetical protein
MFHAVVLHFPSRFFKPITFGTFMLQDDLIFFFILQISSIMGNILQSKANVHIQLDGSLMTYFNWYGRQPDNRSNYLAMKGNQNYQWHDIWPDFKGSFLCEKLI